MLYDLHVERVKRNSHWMHAAPQTKEQVCLFYKEQVYCYAMIDGWYKNLTYIKHKKNQNKKSLQVSNNTKNCKLKKKLTEAKSYAFVKRFNKCNSIAYSANNSKKISDGIVSQSYHK